MEKGDDHSNSPCPWIRFRQRATSVLPTLATQGFWKVSGAWISMCEDLTGPFPMLAAKVTVS